MMHQSCHWFYFANMLSGHNFVPYDLCFYVQGFFAIGATLSIMMTFFVGVDRLISVTMSTKYGQLNLLYYVGSMFIITLAFALYVAYLAFQHTQTIYGKE